jgi:hypothetical protein
MTPTEECSSACEKVYEAGTTAPACQAGCAHEQAFTGGHMEIRMSSDSPLAEYMNKAMNNGMMGLLKNLQNNMMQRVSNLFGHDMFSEVDAPDAHRNVLGAHDGHMPMWLLGGEEQSDAHRNMLGRPDGHEPKWLLLTPGVDDKVPLPALHRLIGGQHDVASSQEHKERTPKTESMDDFLALVSQMQQQMDQNNGKDMRHMMMNNFEHFDHANTLESVRAHEPSPPVDRFAHMDRAMGRESWMACLSRRAHHLSRMSRYMLCAGMLLCVLSMMFICVALMRTAPRNSRHTIMHTTSASAMPYKKAVYADMEKSPLESADWLSDTSSDAPDYARVHDTCPPPYLPQQEQPPVANQADPIPNKEAL